MFLLNRPNAKYYLQTAKITGFGGTLDNKTLNEQFNSCDVKEGIVRVSLLRLYRKSKFVHFTGDAL